MKIAAKCSKRTAEDEQKALAALEKRRANFLGAPESFHLNNLALVLNEAFGIHNYLVGSCLEKRDFRDVDIRCILPDEEFDVLFPGTGTTYQYNARWSLLCAAISEWLSTRSRLKIDFQFQRRTEANQQFNGKRHCLGIFLPEPPRRKGKEKRK